jgi:hypothetical protein
VPDEVVERPYGPEAWGRGDLFYRVRFQILSEYLTPLLWHSCQEQTDDLGEDPQTVSGHGAAENVTTLVAPIPALSR